MRRFRRSRTGIRRSTNQSKEWQNWETIDPGTGFHRPYLLGPGQASTNWLLDPVTADTNFAEPTVLRLIFGMWLTAVMPNFDAGTFDLQFWSGIIVARGEGSNLLQIPQIDPSYGRHDWLWWRSFHFSSLFTTLGTPVRLGHLYFVDSFGPQGGQFDIRTKRRIPQGHGLLMMNFAQDAPDNIGASMLGYTQGRFLLLDH